MATVTQTSGQTYLEKWMRRGGRTFEELNRVTGTNKGASGPHPKDSHLLQPSTRKRTDPKEFKAEGKDLVELGAMLLSQPQRQAALAPKVVGNAAQSAPIIAPQFQPDPQTALIFSRLMGGQ